MSFLHILKAFKIWRNDMRYNFKNRGKGYREISYPQMVVLLDIIFCGRIKK